MSTISPARRALPLLSRIAAAILGSYAFCWGFIALVLAACYAAGMPFHDAEHLSSMLGLLVYLGLFLWVFATGRLARAWTVLLVGAALMTGGAELLQRSLTAVPALS